jgi:hypothetical protein
LNNLAALARPLPLEEKPETLSPHEHKKEVLPSVSEKSKTVIFEYCMNTKFVNHHPRGDWEAYIVFSSCGMGIIYPSL